MRQVIKKFNVYKFHELSDDIKKKVVDNSTYINIEELEWWEHVYNEANDIGLDILEFDLYRGGNIETKFLLSADDICENILKNHGDQCNTFKLANDYLNKNLSNREFKNDLSNEYLSLIRKEYYYLTSADAIIETIKCNDFEYTIDGKFYYDY